MATEVVEDGVLKSVVLDEGETSYATSPAVRIVGARAIGADFAANTVTLSDACEEVRDFAFFNNGHIRTLNVGRGLRTISSHSFAYRNALEKIEVAADNDTFASVGGCLCDKNGETIYLGANAENLELPATCKSIAENAFAYCRGIRMLRLDGVLESIGAYAFCDCSRIENIYVSANVVEIGKGAFCGCGGVDTITVDGSRNAGGTNVVDLIKVVFANIGKVSQVKITGRVGEIALLLGDGSFANTDIDTLVDTSSRPQDEWPYAKNYRREDQTITATFRCASPSTPSVITERDVTVSPGMPFGTLPLPSQYPEYSFVGWYYEDKETFGDEKIMGSSIVRPMEDFAVDAKYEIKRCTVIFYSYDGTTIVKEYVVNYGERVLTPNAPPYDTIAYDFKGWVNRESLSTVYSEGVEIEVKSNLVFDARLTPKGIFDFDIVSTETSTSVSILGFNPDKEDEDIKRALFDSATRTYNLRIPDTMEVQVDGKPKTLKVRTVGYDLYDEDGNPISAEGQTKPDGKPLKPFGYFKHSVIFNDVSLGTNVAKVNAFAFDGFRCRHLILPYSLMRIGNCAFRCENTSSSSLLNSCEVRMENRIVDGDYKDNYNVGLCPVGENFLKVGNEAFAFLNAARVSISYKESEPYAKGTILECDEYSDVLGQKHLTWRVKEDISAAENVGFEYLHSSGKVEEFAWIYLSFFASQVSLGVRAFYSAGVDLLFWHVSSPLSSVPDGCFRDNGYLRCIRAWANPIEAKKVGEYAFGGCSWLGEYPVSGAVAIGKNAFRDCIRIQDIYHLTDESGEILTSIGEGAFYGSFGDQVSPPTLTTTRLAGSTIGQEAFAYSGLTDIIISAQYIKSYAFASVRATTSVVLSDPPLGNTIDIGRYAFFKNPMQTLEIGKCSSIGSYAFANCNRVQSISMDKTNSPSQIGAYAFYYFGQKRIEQDGNVIPALSGWVIDEDFLADTTVGSHAFDSSQLEGLDSAVGQIGDYAFANSALQYAKVRLCTVIGGNAFRNCAALTLLSAVDTDEFGDGLCRDDASLTTAVITQAQRIGDNAFYNATSLLYVVLNTANLMYIGANAFKAEKGKTMQASLFWKPVRNVFGINFQRAYGGGYASSGYTWLVHTGTTKAVINLDSEPHTIDGNEWAAADGTRIIAGIASKTFRGDATSDGISYVYLPNYGTNIKKEGYDERLLLRLCNDAFSGSHRLSVYMPSPCSIADWAFGVDDTLTIYTKPSIIEECTFDTSITNICEGEVQLVDIDTGIGFGLNLVLYESLNSQEYSGSSLVETVRITNNCRSIASSAFSGCGRLRSVTFDGRSNELDIEPSAFQGCTSIPELAVPANTRIEGSAFADCTGIASVSFLAGTEKSTKIGGYAFANCQSLSSVAVSSSVDTIEAGSFYNCPNLHTLHTDSIETYLQIAQRSQSGGNPFYYSSCTRLLVGGVETSSISIYGSLGHLPGWTFRNFTCLKTVALGEGISSIGNSAFEGCENMENISLPASLVTLPQNNLIFSGCNSLATIAVAAGNPSFISVNGMLVGKMDNILYCGRNGNVSIPEGIVDIKDYAFYGFGGLTAVSFPSTLRNIGVSAFGGCNSLTSLEIPSSVSTFGTACFSGCSNLSSVTLDNGIERLSTHMFSYCTSLSTVVVPDSVMEIQSSAFLGSGLASITIGENVRTLGAGVFYNCSHLALVQMRGDCPTVGDLAFQGISSSCVVRIPEGNTTYNVVGGKWQGMTVEYY